MKIAKYVEMPKKEREEKITNRILINLGLGVAAFMLLQIFSSMTIDFSTAPSMPYVMVGVFAVLLIGAVAFYVASKKKPALKNYGHALLAAAVVSLYLNAAMITYWLGMGIVTPDGAVQEFIKNRILNTANAYTYTNWALGIYLVCMFIYNIIFMIVANKQAANAKAKAKASNNVSKYKR